ncbi:hypothetical protein [Leptospira ryugenii]|nr:hypothetical protein [Leptospira ryugenii]
MKRYFIPLIFFSIGLILQFWLYFSWVTFGLLLSSTLLLSLLIYSVSEMSKPPETFHEETGNLHSVERNTKPNISLPNFPQTPILNGEDPILLAKEILEKEKRNRFADTVRSFPIRFALPKISSVMYAYFDGIKFNETLWQKGNLLVDSLADGIEWEENDEIHVRKGNPQLSTDRKRLFLPILANREILGLVYLETKEIFSDLEINQLWLSTLPLAERLLESKQYEKAILDPRTYLFNKSHFYQVAKEKFDSKEIQNLILMKFVLKKHDLEYAICLNQSLKEKGYSDLGLFFLEEQLLASIIPNRSVLEFSGFIHSFVSDLESLGYECEIALGFAPNKSIQGKYNHWIKQAFISLEDSLLSNAA